MCHTSATSTADWCSFIRQLRMWCFDLAYIDRTSWEDYTHMFSSNTEEVDEANENNGIDFLLTTDQLQRYAVRRRQDNENVQEGREIFLLQDNLI